MNETSFFAFYFKRLISFPFGGSKNILVHIDQFSIKKLVINFAPNININNHQCNFVSKVV